MKTNERCLLSSTQLGTLMGYLYGGCDRYVMRGIKTGLAEHIVGFVGGTAVETTFLLPWRLKFRVMECEDEEKESETLCAIHKTVAASLQGWNVQFEISSCKPRILYVDII